MDSKPVTAAKFDAIASDWSRREYANPEVFMERRASLVRDWGAPLCEGDSILEIGCGDGALSCALAAQGFDVTGIDIAPRMIDAAKKRAAAQGVSAQFQIADTDTFQFARGYDAVISFMSAFFTYSHEPVAFLQKILPLVRKKVIVDWNFRSPLHVTDAAEVMRTMGLNGIEWRPWFVPHDSLDPSASGFRSWIEQRPNLSLALLSLKRWHYTIYLKGEKAIETPIQNGHNGHLRGHRLPGSLLQRSLMSLGQITHHPGSF
jgi:SAM-dependent methyltransferase